MTEAGNDRSRVRRHVQDDVHTWLVAALITRAALCPECIARRTGIRLRAVNAVIRDVKRTLEVISTVAACDICHTRTKVHRLG
jgi:hypothetical protein